MRHTILRCTAFAALGTAAAAGAVFGFGPESAEYRTLSTGLLVAVPLFAVVIAFHSLWRLQDEKGWAPVPEPVLNGRYAPASARRLELLQRDLLDRSTLERIWALHASRVES